MSLRRAEVVACGGLAMILIALLFDASPLFVPGVAFTALGVLTPAWVWLTARGARIERRLYDDRVVEDQPVEATIEVSRGPLGLPGAAVADPLTPEPVSLFLQLSVVGGSRSASVRVVARFGRRGLRYLEPPTLIVGDALELARLERLCASPAQELLVLPRTERIRWLDGGGERFRESGGPAPFEPFGATEVDGLRPYRDGTPASRIHWPALARGAGLLERRLRSDSETRPLVVLDARGGGDSEHLDAAVRAAASLALELGRRTGCGLLLPGERRPIEIDPDLAAWPAAHTRLALVQDGADTRMPALTPGVRASRVFYVAAAPPQRLPPALTEGGRAGAVLVVPTALAPQGPQGASFEVAGCNGYALGSGRRQRRMEMVG